MALSKRHLGVFLAALALGACDSATDVFFPSLGGSASSGNGSGLYSGDGPPQLGSTYFEPDGVSPGDPTGTFVGQKVVSFRQELTHMQETIRTQNDQLQAIRNKTIQDSNAYHGNVASMRARLQVGTTPGNPILMNRWESAQAQLNTINDDIVLMNQLAQMISVNHSTASYLLDSVMASFALPGAVDEDHQQLRILEDETQQTVVLIDRLLNELGSDIRRQQAYVNNEKGNLGSLAVAIKNGQLFGGRVTGTYSSPGSYGGHGMGGAQGADRAQMASLSPMEITARTPLVVIRFDRPNIQFEDALASAAQAALQRNPDAVFDVVAVAPTVTGSGAASRNAGQVADTLVEMGVPPARVNLSAASAPGAGANEVRVFVR